jgi:hypothetical protein
MVDWDEIPELTDDNGNLTEAGKAQSSAVELKDHLWRKETKMAWRMDVQIKVAGEGDAIAEDWGAQQGEGGDEDEDVDNPWDSGDELDAMDCSGDSD